MPTQNSTTHEEGQPRAPLNPFERFIPTPQSTLFYTEVVRGIMDFTALVPSYALLQRYAPKGDGHPILVLPGFMASDGSTWPLRRFLSGMGYEVYGWEMGRNVGPQPGTFTKIQRRLHDISEAHSAKVSIIGQSLGGIYAREISRFDNAKITRQVISLGSPFVDIPKVRWQVRAMFQYMNGVSPNNVPKRYSWMYDHLADPLTVPGSAIYTKYDGVTHWKNCIQKVSPEKAEGIQMENIEVVCSHIGMAVNPAALYAIADRLAQPEGDWKPFARTGPASFIYPTPEPVEEVEQKASA